MIGFPSARTKNLRMPPRIDPTALDKERNFLMHIVGQSMKKEVLRGIEASGQIHPSGLTQCQQTRYDAHPELKTGDESAYDSIR